MFGKPIFKSYSGFINLFSRIADPCMVVLAAILAYGFRFSFDNLHLSLDYRFLVLFAVLCVVLIFPVFNLYSSWRGQSLTKQARAIIIAWFSVVLLMITILFSLKVSSLQALASLVDVPGSYTLISFSIVYLWFSSISAYAGAKFS